MTHPAQRIESVVRQAMMDRLGKGATFGYLAYVDGTAAGWVNASARTAHGMYRQADADGPDPASAIGVMARPPDCSTV